MKNLFVKIVKTIGLIFLFPVLVLAYAFIGIADAYGFIMSVWWEG